jgi:parallel beta-helix repeat protein
VTLHYVTLTGTLGIPALGATATFTPSGWLTDATDELLEPPAPKATVLGTGGTFSVSLLATDSTGPLPAGWTWAVSFAGITGVSAYSFSFFLAYASGATQDISTVAPVQATAGMASYLPTTGGTMTGPLAMSGCKVTALGSGTAPADAAAYGQISSATKPVSLLVPAYSYPSPATYWNTLDAAVPPVKYLVANPATGPGLTADPNYVAAIDASLAAGITVLGYINTADGATPSATVETQVGLWSSLYGVTSILLDNAATSTGEISYYSALCTYIHGAAEGAIVVLNHGAIPAEGYAPLADILVVFENAETAWSAFTPASWFTSYPPSKFGVLITSASGQPLMSSLMAQAQDYGIGNLYITDQGGGNPYGTIASYWASETAQAQASVAAYLPLGGGTMTGPLTLAGLPTTALMAAPKEYVDDHAGVTDWINAVTQYGADPTGATDSTAKIQAALTAAGVSGGVVYLPAGRYIGHPATGIFPPSNVTLIGDGAATVLTIPDAYNTSGNLLQAVGVSNVRIYDLLLDGNRTNQGSGNNYGLYVSTSTDVITRGVITQNWTGDGHQVYNSTGVVVRDCISTGNLYHGFECEQATGCTYQGNRGYSNTLHGILISPGEVDSQGSTGCTVIGNSFDSNGEYGIAVNADNGNVGAFLSDANVIAGNSVRGNGQYGIQIYYQNGFLVTGNEVSGNGYFGIFLFESAYNTITSNYLHNNSQAGNGSYDEIFLQGYSSDTAHPAAYNVVSGNQIRIDGGIKARYAINESTAHDGPNTITGNTIPFAGTAGTINSLCPTDILTTPAGVFQIYGTQAIQGANAGIDGAFTNVLRLYNNFSGGTTQIVNPNGPVNCYVGGSDVMDITSAGAVFRPDVATTAGGHLAAGIGAGSALGMYWGSGVPAIAAPQGSLYLRTDGSSGSTRAYINVDGSTGWTAVTTAG